MMKVQTQFGFGLFTLEMTDRKKRVRTNKKKKKKYINPIFFSLVF